MNLRALIVVPSLEIGGAERVMVLIAKGLARSGCEVALVAIDGGGPLRQEVLRLGEDSSDSAVALIELDRRRARTSVASLVRIVRARRPDVILSSQTHLNALIVALRPFLGGAHLVAREPMFWEGGPWESPSVRAVRRRALKRSDIVIASSTIMKSSLERTLGREVMLLENPVDVASLRVTAADPERVPGSGRRFAYLGRLAEGKGIEELLDAFELAAGPDDHLTLVGDGPLRARVLSRIAVPSLAGRVASLGARPDAARVLAGADALVVPSFSEGMPNAALESLAVGTPVIATTDLVALEDLARRTPDGAVTLVPRAKLPEALSMTRILGPGPRPSVLPQEHDVDAVAKSLVLAVEKSMGADPPQDSRPLRIMLPTLAPYPSALASSVQSANMAQAFAELGNEVLVVAANEDPGLRTVAGRTDPASLYDFGPAFRAITLTERSRRGQSYINAVRIARLAQRWRPDLILSRDLRGCLLPAKRGVPTIYEVHSLTSLAGRQERWVIRQLLRAPAFIGFIAISDALADDLTDAFGISRERILVAHDAVRLTSEVVVEPRPRADGTLRVGYTGSLFAGRGIELLVEVASRAPWVELHLVGGPAQAAHDWESRLAASGAGRVVVHGMVGPARARTLQQDMDVVVAPFARQVITDSGVDTSRWMSPMKVFEYMASGRPIVISDLPVLREVLRPDVDALMVPPEDPDALLGALERLRDDPALGERLARSAFDRVRSELTWDIRARRILEWSGA